MLGPVTAGRQKFGDPYARWLASGRAMNTARDTVVAEPPAIDPTPWLQRLDERGHSTRGVLPPGAIDGLALRWPHVGRYGTDGPSWTATT